MFSAILLAVIATICFLTFTWAVKWHFASPKVPTGMQILSLVSLFNFCLYLWSIVVSAPELHAIYFAITLQLISLAVFAKAISDTKHSNFRLIFDEHEPELVQQAGIYSHIRHPFYLAYILFWISCAASSSWLSVRIISAAICCTYVVGAVIEERRFQASPASSSYRAYRSKTGMFFPRILRGRG